MVSRKWFLSSWREWLGQYNRRTMACCWVRPCLHSWHWGRTARNLRLWGKSLHEPKDRPWDRLQQKIARTRQALDWFLSIRGTEWPLRWTWRKWPRILNLCRSFSTLGRSSSKQYCWYCHLGFWRHHFLSADTFSWYFWRIQYPWYW